MLVNTYCNSKAFYSIYSTEYNPLNSPQVLKRMNTLDDKLTVYNKDLNEMGEISMSANESRHKKELLLKVS